MAHFVLRPYRQEMYSVLKEDVKSNRCSLGRSEEDFVLCSSVIQETIGRKPHLHMVNRISGLIPDIFALYRILFTDKRSSVNGKTRAPPRVRFGANIIPPPRGRPP